jgi:predicted PurR-regulated permease PerM
MPRAAALGLAYVIGLGVVVGRRASSQAQGFQTQLEGLLAGVGIAPSSVSEVRQGAVAELQTTGAAVARDSLSRLADVAGALVDLILVLILSVYLAANGTRIAQWLKTETPGGSTRYRLQLQVVVTSRVVGGYIRGVLLLALLVGVLVCGGLAVLGVPYAVLLGVLAFFMEFIPVLGVFISGAAALIIAIVHFQEVLRPLLVLTYFVVVHVIEGDVIGPRLMGKAVGIHPATGLTSIATSRMIPTPSIDAAGLRTRRTNFRVGHTTERVRASLRASSRSNWAQLVPRNPSVSFPLGEGFGPNSASLSSAIRV